MDKIPLNWAYCSQGKSLDELRYSLLYTTLELETTRLEAQEEIRKREDELTQLKELLSNAIRERDEAQDKCQKLLMEKLLHFQQQPQQLQQTALFSGISSIEDEPRRGDSNTGISSSDCEESIVSSPVIEAIQPSPTLAAFGQDKPLPEKGKFLQAVMKAGPLLQTLLLAGPLPQWRYPPPQLDTIEIPPVAIPSPQHQILHNQDSSFIQISNNENCGNSNQRKRSLLVYEGSDSFNTAKYQRIAALH